MSIEDNKSLLTRLSKDENKDTIPNRLQFVKSLLNNNKLKPILDFDNTDTENFINKPKDDDSGESYDTRATLKKEVHDITNVINNMGGTLTYIKSGTTGHTFKGIEKDKEGNTLYEYAVKVVAYSIKDKYGSIHDTRRPENAELLMIKLLSYFIVKKRTPHIVLPIGTFDTSIKHFTNLIEGGYVKPDNEKYAEFVARYNKGEYYDEASVLISEWANRGDLHEFIRKNYNNFTLIHWKVFFFQIISTLAVIQSKFPSFRHNDLKANNILVTKITNSIETYWYKVMGDFYSVPNIGYQIKIWDFDFACIPNIVDNKKVMISNKWSRGINVGPTQNRYYDVHYFFNTLVRKGFFPELLTDIRIPTEVKNFINYVVPPEYQKGSCVSTGGRILHDIEYTTPVEILRTNVFFAELRVHSRSDMNQSTRSDCIKSEPKIYDFLKGSELLPRNINSVKTTDIKASTRVNSHDTGNAEVILRGGSLSLKGKNVSTFAPKTFTKEDQTTKTEKINRTGSKSNKSGTKKNGSISKKTYGSKSSSKKKNKQTKKGSKNGKRNTKNEKINDEIDIEKILLGGY